jgi:4-methoxybenzoate monooxygenase (O-demethylating)
MAATAVPELDFDPFGPEFFDDPYPGHAMVRETAPVVRLPRYDCYAVGRYDEIRTMLTDWESFVSSRGVGLTDYKTHPPYRGPSLVLETDPPLHTHRRNVLNAVLSPAAVRALRPPFAAAAEALAARVAAAGTCDGIRDIAEAYPLTVFPDALGMPEAGRENLLPYGNFVFNSMGPRNALLEASLAELPPLTEWVTRQSQRDALAPGGFGAAIHAAADRGEIAAEEAPLLVRSLLSAGVDTTVNGIGAALYCFARNPDQWARLHADPSLARGAFEEAVRFESPVQTFFRTSARDVVLGGTPIPEGRKVLMFLAAANRDPRRWDEPDRFDITRSATGHVGFGAGIHMCVGQVLARLEGEVMLAALARHVARLEPAGPPRRRHNNTLRGLTALPLRLHRAA